MRLFIALRFDERALDRLMDVQARIGCAAVRCSPVRRGSLHLTLAFLGEISPSRLPVLTHILDGLEPPRSLRFEKLGSFAGGIWWAGPCRSPELERLHGRLDSALRRQGFTLEKRPFAPHVTLVRRAVPADVRPEPYAPFTARVRSVSLMRSQLGGGAPAYTELHAVPAILSLPEGKICKS